MVTGTDFNKDGGEQMDIMYKFGVQDKHAE